MAVGGCEQGEGGDWPGSGDDFIGGHMGDKSQDVQDTLQL